MIVERELIVLKSSLICLFSITLLLVACSEQATPTIYIPAEQANLPISTNPSTSEPKVEQTEDQSSPLPTPSPDCKSNLFFLEDITIPDGTQVQPQETLDKRWLVENNGTCNWDQRFSLRLIAGPEMGVNPPIALYPARSGSQAEIQIHFTAPQEPGIHRSAWQAADLQGNFFGDPIFIEINVISP